MPKDFRGAKIDRIKATNRHTQGTIHNKLSYRRETALQGGLVMAKEEDWNWETIFMDIIGLYSTTATYLASKEVEIGEKNTQNKVYYAVQGHRGRYQSKARMRLPISD